MYTILKYLRYLITPCTLWQASMFYPLYALACQLSPEPRSSGIEVLEADNFRMNCFQTLTGDYLFGVPFLYFTQWISYFCLGCHLTYSIFFSYFFCTFTASVAIGCLHWKWESGQLGEQRCYNSSKRMIRKETWDEIAERRIEAIEG